MAKLTVQTVQMKLIVQQAQYVVMAFVKTANLLVEQLGLVAQMTVVA